MTPRSKLSAPLFLALSAVAASGFADMATPSEAPTAPQVVDVDAHALRPAPDAQSAPAPAAVPAAPAIDHAAVPDIEHYSLPKVTVTAPRLSEDERLRNAVVDRLAADPRLAGRIGVESYRHVVSLTGRVNTQAQVERAEMLARGVDGVRDVDNRLTARVGRI